MELRQAVSSAACALQRHHQLACHPLVEGVRLCAALEFGEQTLVVTLAELEIHQVQLGCCSLVVEESALGVEPGGVDPGERFLAPEAECLLHEVCGGPGVRRTGLG